ncbi:hypothetical protein GCM10009557_77790 [Virgisporangium ochraceum]|uniref:Uncharacterized protein n=1 Tax=Virgisporangium ochraceum TaxID=65505 RepID=A0A8J3ZPN7_9ACTN|nr:hypothetical protein [Virgisporangium ochraceum]GIJ68074.1 hypothetical protein Voc01_029910 [Virgisporangium ochraceum]
MPPPDPDPGSPAVLVLAAAIVGAPSASRWAFVRLFLTALVGVVADVSGPPPRSPVLGDLEVTRRDTGATVLRVDGATADLLDHVRQQLDELTVAEFLDRWSVDPDALHSTGT